MSYSINPFTGKFDRVGVNFIQSKKTPTTSDNKYNLGTEIINTVSHKIYKLKSVISGSANWEEIGAGGVDFKSDVKSIVDCTAVPPTEVVGDRYIINNAGAVNAAWDVLVVMI